MTGRRVPPEATTIEAPTIEAPASGRRPSLSDLAVALERAARGEAIERLTRALHAIEISARAAREEVRAGRGEPPQEDLLLDVATLLDEARAMLDAALTARERASAAISSLGIPQ